MDTNSPIFKQLSDYTQANKTKAAGRASTPEAALRRAHELADFLTASATMDRDDLTKAMCARTMIRRRQVLVNAGLAPVRSPEMLAELLIAIKPRQVRRSATRLLLVLNACHLASEESAAKKWKKLLDDTQEMMVERGLIQAPAKPTPVDPPIAEAA
jgi:hypothetical protein